MRLIRGFLGGIDAQWEPTGGEPIRLRLIGSAALMLQTDYERGTKDSDVLETEAITPAVKTQLLTLAGPGGTLFQRYRMYLEVVARAILFWPRRPVFHPVPALALKNFSVEVMDVTDIIVSKLKRLNQNDADDIKAMAERKLLDPDISRVISRPDTRGDFRSTASWHTGPSPRFERRSYPTMTPG